MILFTFYQPKANQSNVANCLSLINGLSLYPKTEMSNLVWVLPLDYISNKIVDCLGACTLEQFDEIHILNYLCNLLMYQQASKIYFFNFPFYTTYSCVRGRGFSMDSLYLHRHNWRSSLISGQQSAGACSEENAGQNMGQRNTETTSSYKQWNNSHLEKIPTIKQ